MLVHHPGVGVSGRSCSQQRCLLLAEGNNPNVRARHPHVIRRQSDRAPAPRPASHNERSHVRDGILARSAAGAIAPGMPPQEAVEVDSMTSHEVVPGVHMLRGTCCGRFKYEIEYNMKRGTTDNSYLLQAPGAAVLVDVPNEAYADLFVDCVRKLTPLGDITHILLTQLDPKSIPSLEALLAARDANGDASRKLEIVVTNPASRLLQSTLGEKADKAALLSGVNVSVARTGSTIPVGSDGEELSVLVLPTPRWPDMLTAYDAKKRLMFSSKMFSAHVAPKVAEQNVEAVGSLDSANDVGGWDAYGSDWRHFFDCMIAPQSKQAEPALEKMSLVPVPMANSSRGLTPQAQRRLERAKNFGSWLYNVFVYGVPGTNTAAAANATAASGSAAAAAAAAAPAEGQRPVSHVLPMHGPVVSNALTQLIREYSEWISAQVKVASSSCAVVLYASAYGNTAALAQAISRGITKTGVAVDMLNLETESLDDVSRAIRGGHGFIIGSPTLGGHMPTQVQVALGGIVRETEAKTMPCGVFGSFGWSGEAVDEMEQKLKDAGFTFGFEPIRVKFRPTAKDLQVCEESGRELALAIKRRQKLREAAVSAGDSAKQAGASGPTLAMGRVLGSLAVLTAKDEDSTAAMLASWVSQASFTPPGITVAVKKDRAMEPLLIVGAKFAMSMVPESADKQVMKALARPFQPGQDRLANLETEISEASGAPVLKCAHATMDCQVVSRMEAGDHWLVYAQINNGSVKDENALTAVHYRKVGNHY